jgi:hypothetical protein
MSYLLTALLVLSLVFLLISLAILTVKELMTGGYLCSCGKQIEYGESTCSNCYSKEPEYDGYSGLGEYLEEKQK